MPRTTIDTEVIMKGNMSLKVSMGWICACAILLSCAACTREQDEEACQAPYSNREERVSWTSEPTDSHEARPFEYSDEFYKDPYANPNEKIGHQISESFEPAELHGGRYSVYSYEFKGKGLAHKMADVRKYGLDHMGSRGSDVHVKIHVEWPEEQSGLTKDVLAKVRKMILWMNFVLVPIPCPYTSPESLGETEESLLKYNKELWAKEGEERDLEGFGLQPADWATLCSDAFSLETGRLPAKDDGRVTTKSLEIGLSEIKSLAKACYKCAPPEKMNDSWWHCCSQWSFIIDQHIDMPFGLTAKENAKWYERPVLCVWVDGYDNDGGHGILSTRLAKIYSIPDGMELGIEDYFAHDKIKNLTNAIWRRYCGDNKSSDNAAEGKQAECILKPTEFGMQMTKTGIKWTWAKNFEYDEPSVFMNWEELKAFKRNEK